MSILNLLSMKMKLSRIKIVLLMVSIAILLLKQIYAAKQVRQSYNPITAYTHSKMDKWAVGQTEMLNYALVDNITASGIMLHIDVKTTYTPESVIFYECPVDEKIPKLQQEIYAYNVGNNPSMSCVLIGVSNAWNEINYVPSLNIGNPRNINYVMSGFDNWMKTIGQFRVVNCQHEEEEEEEEEGDNIFQEDNGGDQDMDILIYLGLIPALVILNEAIKYIIFELKLKTYISQGKIDQFKYWKRNTENPTNDDAIGFDLVGLAVRTKQGKDSVELSFSKCPRCSKMVKKPPGTLVFQCFGCGSMLIQSIDGTKYVEADYKREMDERYKFHTEAIDAISRNVKQTINVFAL